MCVCMMCVPVFAHMTYTQNLGNSFVQEILSFQRLNTE